MAKELPSRDDVISCLKQSEKAVHAGFIAKHFELTKASYRDLLAFLEELADEGLLRRDGPKRYRVEKRPGRLRETWDGLLSVNPRGFGFVVAAGKTDVFVPAEALNGALHGDTVTVQQTGVNQRGTEGVILAVIRRRSPRVAGMLHIKRRSAWLEPDDTRIRGPIVLHDVPADAQDGFAAVVEITRFPESGHENPEGVIAVVLGKTGEASVEVAKIKAREQIEEEHPPAAMSEAERYAAQSRRLTLGHRTDLRHVPFLTIDPVDARDHDDAVCVERTAEGFKAYVRRSNVVAPSICRTALSPCCPAYSRQICVRCCPTKSATACAPSPNSTKTARC
jgi:ribonuclease R